MLRACLFIVLIAIVLLANPLPGETLSVAPLAKALQNPALDAENDETPDARQSVLDLLLNQPSTDTEREQFNQRLAELARHRETRVGKLFFAGMGATPGIENLPDGLTTATMITRWPLALGSSMQVRVEYERLEGAWKIAAVELTTNGVASAPISGLAPYFGTGKSSADKLDFQPIDYLLGRNPLDRQLPESERSDFDYDTALTEIFATTPDEFADVLNELKQQVTEDASRKDRIAAITPHLANENEVLALKRVDADDDQRVRFWARIIDQIANTLKSPRPDAMPNRAGARVEIDYVVIKDDARVDGAIVALRLESGEISPRGALLSQPD